jgi:hypothetical protein
MSFDDNFRRRISRYEELISSAFRDCFDAPTNKECGCEQFYLIATKLAKTMGDWIKAEPNCEFDAIITCISTSKIREFPLPLYHFLERLLDAALHASSPRLKNSIIPHLFHLYERAIEAYSNSEYLRYARISSVLLRLEERITQVYDGANFSEVIGNKFADLKQKAASIERITSLESGLFEERTKKNSSQKVSGEKRIASGGTIIFDYSNASARETGIIVDFSIRHLCVITRFLHKSSMLCDARLHLNNRDLAFSCTAKPIFTDKSEGGRGKGDGFFVETESDLIPLGKYYQWFEVTDVRPYYYYKALCSTLKSKRKDLEDLRFLDRYNLLNFDEMRILQDVE